MSKKSRNALLVVVGAYAATCFVTYELFWAELLAGHTPSGWHPHWSGFHAGFDLWLLPAVFIGQQVIVAALAAWRGLLGRRTALAWSALAAGSLGARCLFALTTYERLITWRWLYADAYAESWLGGLGAGLQPVNYLIWALVETAVFAVLLWVYLSLVAFPQRASHERSGASSPGAV
jgi:hypothetical protein